MSEEFINQLQDEDNVAYTENKAKAYKTTKSKVLDLFAVSGALRNSTDYEVENKLIRALDEDKLLTMKTLFYTRDIRGGLGERKVPRTMIRYLANNHSDLINQNATLISHYGRYDDLFELLETPCEPLAMSIISNQLKQDILDMENNKPISLLAKWLPSINGSSRETRAKARYIAKRLDLEPKAYRLTLSRLRPYLNITERLISDNNWDEIDYEKVPSNAMMKYRDAFKNHDEARFLGYLEDVKEGTKTIHSGTIYPHEIFNKLKLKLHGGYNSSWSFANEDPVLEEQWKNLPDYVPKNSNVLICADTSSSMTWGDNPRPIDVSLSLALYFAERNTGPYANKFLTFDDDPRFIELIGDTIYEKVRGIQDLYGSTNIEAMFDMILSAAVKGKLEKKDIPMSLVIISDMEFNMATRRTDREMTFLDAMENKYNEVGYDLPNIIFWNVESRNNLVHTLKDRSGVQLVSGGSPSVFKNVMSIIDKTPYDAMLEVLNDERYNLVRV